MVIRAIIGNAKDGGWNIPEKIHIKKRELDALILISRGLDNSKAAEKLGISTNTLRNHVYNLVKKIGANNRANALLIAIEKGMIEIVSEQAVVHNSNKYVLCWKCKRAYLPQESRVKQYEPIVIDHVKYYPPEKDICAYEDCDGKFRDDTIEWSRVREEHPEYPEIPEKGVVYETKELPWYWIDRDMQYQQYEYEIKKEKEEQLTRLGEEE